MSDSVKRSLFESELTEGKTKRLKLKAEKSENNSELVYLDGTVCPDGHDSVIDSPNKASVSDVIGLCTPVKQQQQVKTSPVSVK